MTQDAATSGFPLAALATAVSPTLGPELRLVWDALVQRTPGTDVTQLSAWARVRAAAGFLPLYLTVHRGDSLVGGALILTRRVLPVGAVGYVPYGPLVDPAVADPDVVYRVLADALRQLCRHRLRMLFVQPPEGADDLSAGLLERGFRLSSAQITPPGSIRIDLSEDLADIRRRFGRKLRSWPPRWESHGVAVALGGEQDLPLLVRLMAQTARRQGFTPLSENYVRGLYRELAPGGNVALFIGSVRGEPVAVDLVTVCGEMIRGRLTGFERSGEAARLSVPAAIRWHILQWGKDRGLRWLDFGGLSTPTLHALLDGQGGRVADIPPADQPKLTFGGNPFRYPPPVELVTPAPLRVAYDLAWRSPRGRQVIDFATVALRRGWARRRHEEASAVRSLVEL
jgi:hypothetical protein